MAAAAGAASQAAVGLENARLLEETRQRLREMETLLAVGQTVASTLDLTETMRRLARETAHALGADMVGAYQPDEGGEYLHAVAGYRVPKHLLAGVLAQPLALRGHRFLEEGWTQQRAVYAEDAARDSRLDAETIRRVPVRSVLFFPMVAGGAPVGGLIACWWKEAHRFTVGERRLVEGIGRQGALAIERARLHRAVSQQADRMKALAEIGPALSETLDPQLVARRTADSLRALLGARRSAVHRRDPDSGALVPLAVSADTGPARCSCVALPPGEGMVGLAIREQRPVAAANVLEDGRVALTPGTSARTEEPPCRSALAIPLWERDRVVGAVCVGDGGGRTFADGEIRLAEALADRAALALANARLFEESERRRQAAEGLAELGRLVTQSLEPDLVGRRIAERLCALLGAGMAAIYLLERPSRDLVLVAAAATDGGEAQWSERIGPGTGACGLAVERRAPITSADALEDPVLPLTPGMRALIERSPYRSVLALPLLVGDVAVGALAVWAGPARRFGEEEARLARGFADQAAMAIEHARLYREIRGTRDFLQSITENSADTIVTTDVAGRITYVSPGVEEVFGHPPGDLRGRPVADFYRGGLEEARAVMRRLRAEGRIRSHETALRAADGGWVEVDASISLLRDAAGALLGTVGVVKDARERRSLEEQLRHAQKMEAVGRLAGGIAHDFNNLLTVITGRSALILQRLRPEEPIYRDARLVRATADRAASLTRQLLAFSRRQVLQPQVLDLNAVMANLGPMLRRLIGEDIELLLAPQAGLGRVKADPGQIEQVVVNMVVNSRDAMPQGGRLTVETAEVELDAAYAVRHPGVAPGRYVRLAVSDTGVGMDEAVRSRVFEPFFTTKEPGKGTGLGLATAYGIVTQSGGHVTVHSAPGQGSTFKIYLPRVDEAPAVAGAPGSAAEVPRGEETVLLVEDEPELRGLAREILEVCGYTVLEGRDPDDALLIAERHAGPIHLLLTDVVMPRMSGRALAERLAALRPEMKTLYMSGYTDDAIVHHGVLDLGTAFVEKPFTPEGLARKVREVLDHEGRQP